MKSVNRGTGGFAGWVHSRAGKVTSATLAAAAVVASGLIISLSLRASPAPVPAPAASQPPAAKPVVKHGPLRSPFTGMRVRKLNPVLAVKIDNIVYARPQTGIADADIVYVLPVEGGLSRFMAVFSSHFPRVIGPVRSSRQTDLELLQQFGRPAFAYSGAQPFLLPVVEHAKTVDLYAGRVGGYYRSSARMAPYNLYAHTRVLLAEARHRRHHPSKAHNIGFTFSNAPPPGGRTIRSMSVSYPAASYRFTWSKARHRWLVWMDGSRAMTTAGRQMAPATVVIQYTTIGRSVFREWGNLKPPFAQTIGHGTAVVLRNGRAYRVHWSRRLRLHGTTFTTASGRRMPFARGQVWVVVVAKNRQSRFNESQ
jgi:Protein of unknown function (DUF3048) N-terminal domain/Protein of unknown function (DUF3048) C-terminal domain